MKRGSVGRPIAWASIALIVLSAVAFLFRPRPIVVETAPVQRRHIETAVEAEAKTRVHDRFVISAPVQGRLSRIALEEGDRVATGQHVASIDPLPYSASITGALEKLSELQAMQAGVETMRPKEETLAQARARVVASQSAAGSANARVLSAQAAYEQATREAQRQIELERQGYASRLSREQAQLLRILRLRELQVAKTDAASAAAQVAIDTAFVEELTKKVHDPDYLRNVYGAQSRAIQAQLRTLEDQAKRTDIRSPVSGEVLRVVQKSEAYVTAGAPLLEIGNRSGIEIIADVLSQDAVAIHVGDPVVVVRGAGSEHPRGKVRRIEPSGYTKISALGIEEQRVNVLADLPQRPQSLGDAYRLDVRIVTWAGNVLAVPVPALTRCGTDWCVFTVRNGKAGRTTVRIGRIGDADAEVIGGLNEGDSVILRPSESIRDGTSVRATPVRNGDY